MSGKRLAPRRLCDACALDLLLRVRGGERGIELGCLPLAEHHREHAERELRLVVRQTLGLRGEDAELELPTSLHRLEVERAVLARARARAVETRFSSSSSRCTICVDVASRPFLMIDARSSGQRESRSTRSLCDAAKDRRERARIDRRERTVRRRRRRAARRARACSRL